MIIRGLLGRRNALFICLFVLALGIVMFLPLELQANPQTTDDLAGASELAEPQTAPAGSNEAGSAETAEPDDTAGASEHGEAYEPLPVEPVHREVNNGLLGSGLGASALLLGGALFLDKKRKY